VRQRSSQVIVMRRSLAILLTGSLLLIGSLAFATGASAATFGPTTSCSNGVDNTGGLGLICAITITNTFSDNGGRARVTIRECHGAAGDPTAACTVTTRNLTRAVTTVNQCNDSINGGGGTLRCSVRVTNNYVDRAAGATPATVNQCVGSGESGGIGTTILCDPFPASTTNATITQCNGSANGGTLVSLQCDASGTAGNRSVRINQCNGSANGGGALVICSANIENNRVAGAPAPTPGTGGATPPPTDTLGTTVVSESGANPVLLVGVFLLAFVSLLAAVSRRSLREIRSR
jgi:hypothetical protein